MPQHIMTCHGGSQPATPEEGKAHMDHYLACMGTLDAVACPFLDMDNSAMQLSELMVMG